MRDAKVTNYKIDSRDTLTFKITLKVEDYTVAERELLKWADNNWNTLDLDIIWLVNWDKDKQKKKKIQQLVMNMNSYAEKSNEDIEKLKQELYNRYNVASRKDLTLEQLDYEIESYKFWIFEYSN